VAAHSSTKPALAVLLVGISTLFGIGLLAAGGEAFLRYRERHRATVPGTMPLMYYRHSTLGYALVRNFDYFGWVHINGQGFRGPEVALEKTPGVTRIMAVGGSTTFDSDVTADDQAWPARLAFHLSEQLPARRFEVINAGVPGYRMLADVIRLETSLYRYHPDILVLYQGHNDLFAALRSVHQPPRTGGDTPDEMPTETPWVHWLSRHSMLYAKLADRWNVLQFARQGKAVRQSQASNASGDLTAALDRFRHEVESFVLIARQSGIQVVLAEPVHVSGVGATTESDPERRARWSVAVPFAGTEEVLAGFQEFDRVLREVSAELDVPFITTDDFGLQGDRWYAEGDPIHFNNLGADRMAEQLATRLSATVLECAPKCQAAKVR
jgi:lysophospholipase L1-like esterase